MRSGIVFDATIAYPTKRPNFSIVRLGNRQYAFSYEAIIAYRELGEGWIIRGGKWSHTTNQHLAHIRQQAGSHANKELPSLVNKELPEDDFLIGLNELLDGMN